ncbi:MAG: synthase subunit [Anaerosolibacter sp.]|uniref:AtpZ/AtpI family protein n=1 Tax=Anaerosolibacter sp. TaxID=1872527 RepID=UPI002610D4BC|nr:AtpZ/AtpI family protein [Anaerosolibacter sp.]MDF2545652.1 synthase subunit [Anaerosolibacter sp.]
MENKNLNFLKNLSLLTYIGLAMSIPIFTGVYIGNKMDQYASTGNRFLIICTIAGVGASFVSVYKIVMNSIQKK